MKTRPMSKKSIYFLNRLLMGVVLQKNRIFEKSLTSGKILGTLKSTHILYTGFVTGVLRTGDSYGGVWYLKSCICSWGFCCCCHLTDFVTHFENQGTIHSQSSKKPGNSREWISSLYYIWGWRWRLLGAKASRTTYRVPLDPSWPQELKNVDAKTVFRF